MNFSVHCLKCAPYILKGGVFRQKVKKCLIVMKFILLLLAISMQASAYSQLVTLNYKSAPLREVLKSIRQQTGYNFFIESLDLEKANPVTLTVKSESIDKALQSIFENQPFNYQLLENTIIIKLKTSKSVEHKNILKEVDTDTIRGKVINEKGEPVIGATVLFKNSKIGTTTNADGYFSIVNVQRNTSIIISNIGFLTQEVITHGKNTFRTIELKTFVNVLDQTTIIAYGRTSKRISTDNSGGITAKEISQQPVQNSLLALQGRVTGIFIEQATGMSGSGVKVRIQGQNSLSKGSDPLYVVDGIPYSSSLLPSLSSIQGSSGSADPNGVSASGNPLSFINPADIESMDVLKDADATAIYGSRAANGAILITTKKGKAGKTKVDINMLSGWGEVTRKLDVLKTKQYLEMRREAIRNDNVRINPNTDFDLTYWDQNRYTDWQKVLIGGTAHYNDAGVSISGGNTITQFLVSGTYHKETTVMPGDLSDQKGSFHFNLNTTSNNQKFKLQLDGKYQADNNKLVSLDYTTYAINLAPNAPFLYNSDGTLNWEPLANGNSTWTNPLSNKFRNYSNNTKNLLGNILLSYQLLPCLYIKTSMGYTNLQANEITSTSSLTSRPEIRSLTTGFSSFGYGNINSWIIEPQATFNQVLGPGTLEVLVGSTLLRENKNRQAYNANGFNSDELLKNIRAATSISAASQFATEYRYNAVFGRLNYNIKNQYIINFTARRDGSSRFGSRNLSHNFGSVAGAWIFSNENFIKKNLLFLSFGKLRASYGTTGSDQIGDYKFMSLYNPASYPVPYQNAIGYKPNGLPNPYLQWEETRKLQFGADLGFLSNNILLNVNYYRNRSSNQLQSYSLPITSGFNSVEQNSPALIENTGWEFSVNLTNIKNRSFSWNTNFNITIPHNKLVKYDGIEKTFSASTFVIGEPVTIVKAFKFLGVDPLTGTYQVADRNGIASNQLSFTTDRSVIINTGPIYYGGFLNNFNYKGLSLDILFQFAKQMGNNYIIGTGNNPGVFTGTSNIGNQPVSVLDRWQNPGDKKIIQRYSSNNDISANRSNAQSSNIRYSDASFIRLKNLFLSWQLPVSVLSRIKLQNLRLYMQGQNLLTITKYQGIDPETKSLSLPPLRIITAGLQLTL
jgi:TonB-linked SusC/RagA family outer membrane protein